MSRLGSVIKSGSIVIGKHPGTKDAFNRWRVESMNVGDGKRWSYILDYPLVVGQEPLMIETSVLIANCRLADKDEINALVVCIPTGKESAA